VSLDPKIASLGGPAVSGEETAKAASPSPDGQRLARLAGEFESMLLLQMLREMRKSGSWKDEDEEKDGFGAATLFDTLDQELASYITRAQGFGLEKSLVKQVTGTEEAAPSNTAPSNTLPANLPSLDLPLPTSEALPIAGRVETSRHGSEEIGCLAGQEVVDCRGAVDYRPVLVRFAVEDPKRVPLQPVTAVLAEDQLVTAKMFKQSPAPRLARCRIAKRVELENGIYPKLLKQLVGEAQ